MLYITLINEITTLLTSVDTNMVPPDSTTSTYESSENVIKDLVTHTPLKLHVINDELYLGSTRLRDIASLVGMALLAIPLAYNQWSEYQKTKDENRNENYQRDMVYRKLKRDEELEILEYEEKRRGIERRQMCRRQEDSSDYTGEEKRFNPERRSGTDRRHELSIIEQAVERIKE